MIAKSNSKPDQKRAKIEYALPPQMYRILLPLASLDEAAIMLPLAEALVREQQGQLVILHVVTVPEGRALSEGTVDASRSRQAFTSYLAENGHTSAQVKTVVRVAWEVWEGIWETVEQEQIDLLLFAQQTRELAETAVGDQLDPRLAQPPCAVVAVRPGESLKPDGGWLAVRRILLPASKEPSAGLPLRISQVLGDMAAAEITLFHVVESGQGDESGEGPPIFDRALRGLDRVTRLVTAKGDVSQAILLESTAYDVVVMGAASRRVAPDGWRGPILDAVSSAVLATLIVVKEQIDPEAAPFWPAPRSVHRRDRPVAVIVDKWFAENTFHSREFADLDQLLTLKQERGLTISLCLPALNEQETVGNVIRTVKNALMDRVPLLDEMVLIDSGSVDYTREIAADLGIPVYLHQEILPQHGSYVGKGEALWKSLFVLKGDVVAWIDTDIKNVHPRFLYGVLGPLLREPRIQYVKGFYRRPLIRGDRLVAGGGGRVTELTARPFINLFYPELSGLIQPLSGEYAGMRKALEQQPFFTGYGVETGLLIDLLGRYGLQAIAQVDLLERIHRNQKLRSLSKMSFAIMQVVMKRLEAEHDVRLLHQANLTMNLIRRGPSRFYIDAVEILERERPPMRTIPEYRELWGLDPLPHQPPELVEGDRIAGETRPA